MNIEQTKITFDEALCGRKTWDTKRESSEFEDSKISIGFNVPVLTNLELTSALWTNAESKRQEGWNPSLKNTSAFFR